MERESFEDQEVAEYLNDHFIAIKVDREERPDIDHIYMSVCQALTGQGGWPLTVVMTPDKKPFFAGTYFPRTKKYGRMGLLELLARLEQVWREDRDKAQQAGEDLVRQLRGDVGAVAEWEGDPEQATSNAMKDEPTLAMCERAYHYYLKEYDTVYGGFGGAPKFPAPHNLSFLLRQAALTGERRAGDMALHTLRAMYRGGIWDHVGFGFARYSTDEKWLVPHFEKMLYDNALLAHAYLDAFAYSGEAFFAAVAEDIFSYIGREMTSPDGTFYSAQDADSEGEEGKFYVFTEAQLQDILGADDARWFGDLYGSTAVGNFEGATIFNLIDAAPDAHATATTHEARLADCRERLYKAREKRIPPYKDDKILTAWNALMISALAKGGRLLAQPDLTARAKRAMAGLRSLLLPEDGRWLARYREGEAKHLAYLEDYAYLTWAEIELYEATFAPQHLARAVALTEETERLFGDPQGGYYFYGSDAEELLTRPKEYYDGAMPSGNSVQAHVLARLVQLTGNVQLQKRLDRQIAVCYVIAKSYPIGHAHFLMALQTALHSPVNIVLSANQPDDPLLEQMITAVRPLAWPLAVIQVRTDEVANALAELAPFTTDQAPRAGTATAYVCYGFACREPVHSVMALRQALAEPSH